MIPIWVWFLVTYLAGAAVAGCTLGVLHHRRLDGGRWKKYRDDYPNHAMVGYAMCAMLWPIAWIIFVPDAMEAFGAWWDRKPPQVEPPYKAPVDPKTYRENA